MVASTAAVDGKVVDSEGVPVPGVAIETRFEYSGYSYGGLHHTTSREDGSFTLSDIAVPTTGNLSLRMQPPGFYGGVDVPGEKNIRLTLNARR